MEIKWKIENITFNTLRESEVWADSIANEIYSGIIDGYITNDIKIAYVLSFTLASFSFYRVQTEKVIDKESISYKIWVSRLPIPK